MERETGLPDVVVIIPVFNRRETTLQSLRQLQSLDWSGADVAIAVVDDGSTDGTSDAVRRDYPSVVVLQGDGDLWWTGAINMGLRYAVSENAKYALLLNDDLDLDLQFFSKLWPVAEANPEALVSGVKVIRGNDDVERVVSGPFLVEGFLRQVTNPGSGNRIEELQEKESIPCDLLGGAVLLIPLEIISEIGYLDTKRFPHNWGDFDFTRRANLQGFPCLVATAAKVITDGNNANYERRYKFESTRRDYVRNLFDKHKYFYGFNGMRRKSFFHKPFVLGALMYAKLMARQGFWTTLKLILPRRAFIRLRK